MGKYYLIDLKTGERISSDQNYITTLLHAALGYPYRGHTCLEGVAPPADLSRPPRPPHTDDPPSPGDHRHAVVG